MTNVLYPLEEIPFSNQCSHSFLFISMFHYLMKGRWDDGVAVDPWLSHQQVVRRVGINNITCHFRLQILDLPSKFDLSHRARTIGIEAINGRLCSAQSMGGNPYVLHNPAGHNAQHIS